MPMPGMPSFFGRFTAVLIALALCVAGPAWGAGAGAATPAAPWGEPHAPGEAPLPRSASLAAPAPAPAERAAKLARTPVGSAAWTRQAVGLGVAEVLSGRPGPGADRLAGLASRAGNLAGVAAYYQGLGRYLAGEPDRARAVLAGLAARPGDSFLGRDALYLSILCAARLEDQAAVAALAGAWLAFPDQTLAPEIWLRAAVAAQALGDAAKSQDFLRHLSLSAPWTRAARAGDALARAIRAGRSPAPPAADPGADAAGKAADGYDPEAPGNLLLRAEALAEKGGQAEAALALLSGFGGGDAAQAGRAEYIRGKALYALRRTKAARDAFARAAAADPASSLALWARYHQARCLWRSLEPEDVAGMETLLRQVLAAPIRDDRLREAATRHLVLLYLEQGRFAEGLAQAEGLAGLAVSPDLAAQGASLTALLRFVAGDFAGAEAGLAAFAARFPEDEWADGARYWRGKALVALDRPDEAMAVLAEAAANRPNTYHGDKAAALLAALRAKGQPMPAVPDKAPPRCPDAAQPADPASAAVLAEAGALDQAGLPQLAEMLLEFGARQAPGRADLALAHLQAASAAGRRSAALRTAWRTFGGCLLRGTAAGLAPLRRFLYPRDYAAKVETALAGSGVDPDIVYALIRQESFFDPRSVSGAGAVGLMQMMPDTARAVARRLGLKLERDDLFEPDVNIRLGTAFFLERLAKSGNLPAALAGYNAGENRVALWNRSLAPLGEELFIELIPYTETRDYVRRILANAMMYGRLYAGPGR